MQDNHEEQNSSYAQDLSRTRKMVSTLLDLLEEEIACCSIALTEGKTADALRYEAIWGAKESVLSALAKLSQLQIRLLPLEHEYSAALIAEGLPNLKEVLREEYMEALERFFHKQREAGLPLSPAPEA